MAEERFELDTENADNPGDAEKVKDSAAPTDSVKEDQDSPKRATVKKIGRCFEVKKLTAGTAGTERPQGELELHYYIELLDDGSVALEMVGSDGEPTGQMIDNITMENFSEKYKTCSQHDCTLVIKTLDEIRTKMSDNRVKMGEEHLAKGEVDQAKDKFKRALKFDEESIKANFGMGKTLLKEGKSDEAAKIFTKLSNTEALFDKDNKHTFNEFGIELRKQELYDLAISNYEKAILIDPEDEALYYNLSRAYERSGVMHKAIEKMKEALKTKPDFPEAQAQMEILLQEEKDMLKNLMKNQNNSA